MTETIRSAKLMMVLLIVAGMGPVFGSGQSEAMPESSESPVVIRLGHTHQANAESSEIHYAATAFKDYVEANSDSITVEIFPNNELGEERVVYEAMQLGSGASASISGTAILNNFSQRTGVLDLPFLWADYDHVHRVLDGEVGDALAADLLAEGFRVLAWMDSWGYRSVYTSTQPVREPEDLSGLKIRTIPTPIYVAAVNAMGANATPMAFGEVYTAMQTGVLDGFEHGASIVVAQRFYEVASYGTITNHLFGPLAFVFSEIEWQNLSPEQRVVVQAGAEQARDAQRELAPQKEAAAFDFLREQGMEFFEIDTSSFEANAQAAQDELAAEINATGLLGQIRAAR